MLAPLPNKGMQVARALGTERPRRCPPSARAASGWFRNSSRTRAWSGARPLSFLRGSEHCDELVGAKAPQSQDGGRAPPDGATSCAAGAALTYSPSASSVFSHRSADASGRAPSL